MAPDETLRAAASHLGLFCLPMSNKRDVRLKRVNGAGKAITVQPHHNVPHYHAFFQYPVDVISD